MRVENVGSTTRDFLALERNWLTHIRLVVLLSLLSSSILLRSRLSLSPNAPRDLPHSALPVGSLYFAGAVAVSIASIVQYRSRFRDFFSFKGFLRPSLAHTIVVTMVALLVFVTCVLLLIVRQSD
ncbi:hypothetical protein SISSUDRAFT_988406 [Sistotremastrum suecicum HHB10207 ss-3]|uniref:DUF202 domain-containing protein n=1 Tax=Sistotremastrum suecicum HHB10207 ss-3 TaxID=1314776 RepID=A0A166C2F8_9AGAM|nr:hypothetical protein SISSUDRAFT_988406 [Sistotremastrum suecicum HHB10207 ss-3]